MLTSVKIFIEKLIREETLLRFFNIKIPKTTEELLIMSNKLGFDLQSIGNEQIISTETLQILYATFIYKARYGIFDYPEVENLLFGILLIRFIYLIFTKNLYTAVCITGICAFAGYLWYGHWMDITTAYKEIFKTTTYFRQLGVAADINLEFTRVTLNEVSKGPDIQLSNFYKLPYFIIYKGIIRVNGVYEYRIDPISMLIAKMDNPPQFVINIYYRVYNEYIPQALAFLRTIWGQFKGLATYTIVTRIGKRYCPYFVRWHWTILYMVGMLEALLINSTARAYEYMNYNLASQLYKDQLADQLNLYNPNILLAIEGGMIGLQLIAACHLAFTSICLLHAVCGQYFYIIFATENTELHVGPRPKNSIYSCGYTSWQDEKEKSYNRLLPKLWYGWFGRGTDKWSIIKFFQNQINNLLKFIYKLLKRVMRILRS